jgi:hypothetical protein
MSILVGILNSRDQVLTTTQIVHLLHRRAVEYRDELSCPGAFVEYFFESGNSIVKDRYLVKLFSRHRFTSAAAAINAISTAVHKPDLGVLAHYSVFDADRDLPQRAAVLAPTAKVFIKITDTDFIINAAAALGSANSVVFFDVHGYYTIANVGRLRQLDAAYNCSFGDGVINGPFRLFKTCTQMFTYLNSMAPSTTVI